MTYILIMTIDIIMRDNAVRAQEYARTVRAHKNTRAQYARTYRLIYSACFFLGMIRKSE